MKIAIFFAGIVIGVIASTFAYLTYMPIWRDR